MDTPQTPPTRTRRTWGAALLLLGLLALVLGVFGAVYFQGGGPSSRPQVANNAPTPNPSPPPRAIAPEAPPQQALAPAENKPQDQAAVPRDSAPPSATDSTPQSAEVSPAPPTPAAPEQGHNQPQNQSSNYSPSLEREAERLAQISPTAAPANVASATPRYWVEFGAYDTAHYADHLKQRLSRLGIDATIANARGKDGRNYLRVRTTGDSDRATASQQLTKAQSSLHIRPLLHRAAAVSPVSARAPVARAKPASRGTYWVQFGAFRDRRNAETLLSKLHKKRIQASVFERKNSDLEALFLVRMSGFSTYAQASQAAQRSDSTTHGSGAFIGQDRASSSRPNSSLNPRPPAR